MKHDDIFVEVLADGTIKSTTNKVSAQNHSSAHEFLQYLARLAGGTTTTTKRSVTHAHTHNTSSEEQKA